MDTNFDTINGICLYSRIASPRYSGTCPENGPWSKGTCQWPGSIFWAMRGAWWSQSRPLCDVLDHSMKMAMASVSMPTGGNSKKKSQSMTRFDGDNWTAGYSCFKQEGGLSGTFLLTYTWFSFLCQAIRTWLKFFRFDDVRPSWWNLCFQGQRKITSRVHGEKETETQWNIMKSQGQNAAPTCTERFWRGPVAWCNRERGRSLR